MLFPDAFINFSKSELVHIIAGLLSLSVTARFANGDPHTLGIYSRKLACKVSFFFN